MRQRVYTFADIICGATARSGHEESEAIRDGGWECVSECFRPKEQPAFGASMNWVFIDEPDNTTTCIRIHQSRRYLAARTPCESICWNDARCNSTG